MTSLETVRAIKREEAAEIQAAKDLALSAIAGPIDANKAVALCDLLTELGEYRANSEWSL